RHSGNRDVPTYSPGRLMQAQVEGTGARVGALLREMVSVVSENHTDRVKEIARTIGREPFARQTWSEFFFLTIGAPLALVAVAFVLLTMGAGAILAITFFGLAILALSIRGARGIGGLNRQL